VGVVSLVLEKTLLFLCDAIGLCFAVIRSRISLFSIFIALSRLTQQSFLEQLLLRDLL